MPLTKDTKTIVDTRTQEIPNELLSVVNKNLSKFAHEIKEKFDLSQEDSAALANELVLTTLAFEPIEDLAVNITKHTSISPNNVSYIAEKVTEELLSKSFETLVEINQLQLYADLIADEQASDQVEEVIGANVQSAGVQTEAVPTKSVATGQALSENEIAVAAGSETANQPIVELLHTMEQDVDRIHGYGAYRKMYPETIGQSPEAPKMAQAPSSPFEKAAVPENLPQAGAPVGYAQAEPDTVQSLSQEEMLKGKLTETPKYTDPNA